MSEFTSIQRNRPLARHGNAANLEPQNKIDFRFCKKILLFCTPDWLHSHRCARGLYQDVTRQLAPKEALLSIRPSLVVVVFSYLPNCNP